MDGISNEEIYNMFQLLSLHGQSKDALAKTQGGSWEYDIVYPAFKCNMTDIMSAIGISQLNRYKALLQRQVTICNRIKADILNHAQMTYFDVTTGKNKFLVGISCDFKKLEQACNSYNPNHKSVTKKMKSKTPVYIVHT